MKAPNTIIAAPTSVRTIRITVPAAFLVGVVVPMVMVLTSMPVVPDPEAREPSFGPAVGPEMNVFATPANGNGRRKGGPRVPPRHPRVCPSFGTGSNQPTPD